MHPRIIWTAIALTLCPAGLMHGQNLEWIRQLGTSEGDFALGALVSADAQGRVYLAGMTHGSLGGPHMGLADVFVGRFDADGTLAWAKQIGTSANDDALYIDSDGLGNVYVAGGTFGDLGGSNAGGYEAFISKFDAAGAHAWTRQFGSQNDASVTGISADDLGNIYISTSSGSNISKYTTDGSRVWTHQIGTPESYAFGVATDGLGNVYVTGGEDGDVYVSKVDANGVETWNREFGTSEWENARGVAADESGVYLTGWTEGSFAGQHEGGIDTFLARFSTDGTHAWTHQFGTEHDDYGRGISLDVLGNIYLSGVTTGSLGGPHAGLYDAFLSKFSADGDHVWSTQLGTREYDQSRGVSADGLGNVYISGFTEGDLEGMNAGSSDLFLAKFSDRPPLPGDTNGDGLIDINDLNNVRNEFGLTGDNLAGDLNGDFVVDSDDLNIVRNNFGATAGAAAVPEPASGSLLATCALLACCMVRRTPRPLRRHC